MAAFAELAASRRAWIENELKTWCVRAPVSQLKLAELEWTDIAGKVDPEGTLWAWAWSRFPALYNADLGKIDEAQQVVVTLQDGRRYTGYPDARKSRQAWLVLVCRVESEARRFEDQGPFSLDEITSIGVV